MSINWVMMARDGEIVKLPGETIYYKVRSRIALDLAAEPATSTTTTTTPPFSVKSDSGILYLTNLRLVYLPAHPTDALRSFSAPILDVTDSCVVSRFFGPWSWTGLVRPTPGGGVPAVVARLVCRLTFKDGGHDAFQTAFEARKEQLAYARALEAETGQVIPAEDLPRYEGPAAGPSSSSSSGSPDDKERLALEAYAAAQEQARLAAVAQTEPRNEAAEAEALAAARRPQATTAATTTTTMSTISTNSLSTESSDDQHAARLTPTPDEPPPDYEAAQAQAVDIRLEARLREEAER